MKNKIIAFALALTASLSLVSFAYAQEAKTGGIVPNECRSAEQTKAQAVGTESCSVGSLVTLAIRIVYYLITMAFSVTLLFMLWGGLQMLMSAGNPEGVKRGKQTIYYALLGFAIVMCSYIIISLMVTTVTKGQINGFEGLIKFLPTGKQP
jgi:hypothetical protein